MIYEFIAVSTFLASCLNGQSFIGQTAIYQESEISVEHLRTFFLPQDTSRSQIFGKIKQDFFHFLKEDLLGKEYIVTALKGSISNHFLIFVNPSDQSITIEIEYPKYDRYTSIPCRNGTLTLTLQPHQTDALQFECDVAGIFVNASRKVALYYVSSTPRITLTEQVLPIKLWGQHYVVLPSRNPDDKQIILIQTAHNNTDVHILGYDYVTVPNRFLSIQRRIMGTLPVTIKSSKPVSVSQVLFSVNEAYSVMINIVPVKYSVEKSTLQNSPLFEYGYLKNSGLEGSLKVPLSQYTYNNGSFDTLPDTVYGCTMMHTSASEPLYPRTNCGDWNDSKTDNPWPTMTPGDGVDNNDNDQVDEEDCFSDFMNNQSTTINKTDCKVSSDNFETLFVIPTPDVDSLTLHCPIMNDNEASFSYDKGMQWSETTGNVKIKSGHLLLLKMNFSTKINMIKCHYESNNMQQISNDFSIPSVDNLQTQYVAVLPNSTTIGSQLSEAICGVGNVFDRTNFTSDGKTTIFHGNSFIKQNIRVNQINMNQAFIIASHIISVHCYVKYDEYYVINHLMPVSGNSFTINKTSINSSEEQLTVISTDSNTLIHVVSLNQSECSCSRNEYYLLIEKGGDIRRFPMEEEFDVFYIKCNKPVIVMILYKNEKDGSLSSYLYQFDYVPPTNLQSTYNLWSDQSFKRRYGSTSNQIPGDQIDNDQDGLIDEEYCGLLWGDTDVLDVDLDGSLNEDCKGCPDGQELEPVMTCRDCNIGTYRENSSLLDIPVCQACAKNMTTFYTKSVSSADCFPICEEGMELDNVTRTCRPCLVGYYKDISANDTEKNVTERFWCKKCPENKTTYTSGTVVGGQCIDHCGVGMYLEGNGCHQCGVGFFKNTSSEMSELREELRWNCSKCPEGQTTSSTGADKCIELCIAGKEFNKTTGLCDPCNYGFFKNVSGNHIDCYKCPDNFTTWHVGGTEKTQCKPAFCDDGKQSNNVTGTCEPCPVGFYKGPSNDRCQKCPPNKTTFTNGSVSLDECIENCLKGNEYNSTTRQCAPCNHGFFKNISGNHIDCYQCPVNHTTKVLGATDITQCKPAGCMCPCNMVHTPKNFTDEELTKNIEEMKKKLAVNKEQLSSSIRKKISVKDDRPSAKAVGSVGVVILAVCFGLLIALDYVTLTRHILGLLREIRNLFLRN
ncbi:uncharacterized protein [Magallana gigas]|uniref:uncharacterized protein isoform X4 n=1 Tax=Magallana gigas TaxID=29159 RepID=UPI003341DD45